MTLTRADVEEILRLRYEFTKEKWGDGTVDAWWELLGDLDAVAVRRRIRELIRGGATSIPPGLLASSAPSGPARSTESHECSHEDRTHATDTHSRCNRCRAELYSANDPRIATQWDRWVAEGKASRKGAA